MNPLIITLLVLDIITAMVFTIYRAYRCDKISLILKILASTFFTVTGVVVANFKGSFGYYAAFIEIGLILGILGDIMLNLKSVYSNDTKFFLISGFLFFGIGHMCYFGAIYNNFLTYNIDLFLPIILSLTIGFIFIGAFFFISKVFKYDLFGVDIPAYIYVFILSCSTGFAIIYSVMSKTNIIFSIGISLFLLSDLVLSNMYFNGNNKNKYLSIINHCLYYSGQILIAISILYI